MKKVFISALILLSLVSCASYKEFISVQNMNNIPDGTLAILLTTDIDTVKEAFINQGIMVTSMEGGFKTEEILLDEGTRAMYKAHEFDNQVKLIAFWGITQKVKADIAIWVGVDAVSAYDVHAWDRVVYEKEAIRPKKVFDYAVQIMNRNNLQFIFR